MAKFQPPQSNPALFTDERHEIYMGESPELDPKPHECIVHVRCNGICGSDVHFWHTGRIGNLEVQTAHCLGHEGAGEVVWTGSDVKHLKPGDRVAIEPGVPCGDCFECSSGHYNLCPDVKFSGVPPYTGSMRRYHVHHASYLHKMPDNLTYADGALLEPLSVALRGFERGPLKLGEAGVVFGAGPIGLITLAVAKAAGACPLIITDLDRGRLDFAEKFVPGAVGVQVDLTKSQEEMAMAIREAVKEKGGDVPRSVFECTGVQSSVVTASYVPRPAGEVIVIGVGKAIMNELPFMHLSMAEVDLKFINRYHHSWPQAMRLLSHGVLDLKPLVTHRYPLEKADEALRASADRSTGSIKIHVEDGDAQELSISSGSKRTSRI